MKGFALGLALKQRRKATRIIVYCATCMLFSEIKNFHCMITDVEIPYTVPHACG